MAPARRPATPAPVTSGINLLDDDGLYVGVGSVPEGDYVLEFNVQMHSGFKAGNNNPPRLGVMVNAYPLGEPEAMAKQFFLGFGKNSEKSFVPSADGKGIDAIPGAPALTLNDSTNWNIFRQSLFDCGLPRGVAGGSFAAIDGIWVHLTNVPEPESRKSMKKGAATGEVQQEEIKGSGTVPVVSEIKDDGKPWEGTGGFEAAQAPAAAPARPGRPTAAPPARPAARPAARAAAPASAAETGGEGDVETAAINALAKVFEAKPTGCTKLLLRTETFKAVTAADGPEMAQLVTDTYFGSDDSLNGLLGQVGFVIAGIQVKPQ